MFGGLSVHTKDVVKCEILNILNIPNLEEVMANYFLTLWILEILQYLNKLVISIFFHFSCVQVRVRLYCRIRERKDGFVGSVYKF